MRNDIGESYKLYSAPKTGSIAISAHLQGAFNPLLIWKVLLQSLQNYYVCSFTVKFYPPLWLPH